ncbi:MAG: lysophospholipase [Anaerolineae bacterium]|nr:lysophospholipase [Anaerolineae bacterium]
MIIVLGVKNKPDSKEIDLEHQDGIFHNKNGANIFYQSWLPEGEIKAVLLIVHGLAEHSGRYMNVVNHFVPLGYAIYSLDHLGHGKSDGMRVFVEHFEDYINPLNAYFDMVQGWQPGKAIFLVGHSMGGLIVSNYLIDFQEKVAGAVLSGPSIKVPENISSTTVFLGKLFSVLLPKLGLIGLEADGISRDPQVVEAYVNDALVHTGKTTARLAAELLKAMIHTTAKADKITLPVIIVQGGADKMVDPSGTQMLFDTVGSPDKTLKIYDDLYHEVFNESEHNLVLGDIQKWLEIHLPK